MFWVMCFSIHHKNTKTKTKPCKCGDSRQNGAAFYHSLCKEPVLHSSLQVFLLCLFWLTWRNNEALKLHWAQLWPGMPLRVELEGNRAGWRREETPVPVDVPLAAAPQRRSFPPVQFSSCRWEEPGCCYRPNTCKWKWLPAIFKKSFADSLSLASC